MDNEPLQPRSIQRKFEGYKRLLEFNQQLSPHVFRHTFAKRSILSGINAFSLAALLGHSDLTITRRYVNFWSTDLEEQARNFSTLGKLKL
ncbi:tyrosine-type recombinase/integrase [Bacillus sp. FSL K6-3431]|uniref:tyrosine-type recombinase/integrase n=1 Tax=Bacillus sp. FSL K6-3431 TaxID=2921500 RepID=UPI0030FA4711